MTPLTEAQEQEGFTDWLAWRHFPFFHVPNETGGRDASLTIRAAKMKRAGVKRGVPDLFVFIPVKGATGEVDSYQPLAIEMKRAKGGKVSPEQEQWGAILQCAGIPWRVCHGCGEAMDFVRELEDQISGGEEF